MQSNPETVSRRIADLLAELDAEFPDLAIAIVVGAELEGAVALTRATNLSSEGLIDMLEDAIEVEEASEDFDADDDEGPGDPNGLACDCPNCRHLLADMAQQGTIH